MRATTDGVAQLRAVLQELSAVLSLVAARRVTKSLSLGAGGGDIKTDTRSLREAQDEKKQLWVEAPKLPPWADEIRQGTRVEYLLLERGGGMVFGRITKMNLIISYFKAQISSSR